MQTDRRLTKAKKNPCLTYTSANRAELIAAGVCVACPTFPVAKGAIHCSRCIHRLALADKPA
jgi:hypothetical protein